MAKRQSNGTFAKGQSGNPGGRPKKLREVEEIANNLMDDGEGGNRSLSDLDKIAHDPDIDIRARIRAHEILLAYGPGKPRQRHEVDVNDKREEGVLGAMKHLVKQAEREEGAGVNGSGTTNKH